MFLMKIHESDKGNIVAVCDADILGKSFESGEFCLRVEDSFFGGHAATAEEIAAAIRCCATANIAGNRIIAELLAQGTITEKGVKEIQGVKYSMIFRL